MTIYYRFQIKRKALPSTLLAEIDNDFEKLRSLYGQHLERGQTRGMRVEGERHDNSRMSLPTAESKRSCSDARRRKVSKGETERKTAFAVISSPMIRKLMNMHAKKSWLEDSRNKGRRRERMRSNYTGWRNVNEKETFYNTLLNFFSTILCEKLLTTRANVLDFTLRKVSPVTFTLGTAPNVHRNRISL